MVDWKKLGEICELERGVRVIKKDLQQEGLIPVYQNSLTPLGYFDKSNYPECTPFVICAGAAGEVGFCSKPFWAADDCTCILCSSLANKKYIYYCLLVNQHTLKSQVRKASVPRLSKDVIGKLVIPIPSLEEQARIVSILDTFTSSIDNLKQQIAQRRKQYEYYRDQLLDLEGKEGVAMKTLGDVCQINAGGDVPKDSFSDCKTEHYCVPIISNGVGEKAFYGYTDLAKISKPSVTIAARGTIGYAEYRAYPYYPIVRLISVTPLLDNVLNAKFLYYKLIKQNYSVSTSGIPQLTIPMVKMIIIPVPSLSEQQRIVSILDTFEASIRNLEQQLAQREKQYEYYRNKLLTSE